MNEDSPGMVCYCRINAGCLFPLVDVEEQYGTNNEFASPVILICAKGEYHRVIDVTNVLV